MESFCSQARVPGLRSDSSEETLTIFFQDFIFK